MPDPLLAAVALRRALYRPAVRWTSVVIVGLATALVAGSLVRAAADARDRWGRTRPVAVARRDLEPGEMVGRTAVTVEDLPTALVGDRTLSAVPRGSVVRYPVARGEPLVADRLAPEGVTGVAALVPAGHRAVGVPAGPGSRPPLAAGDRVDVLVVLPSGTTTGDTLAAPAARAGSRAGRDHERDAAEPGDDARAPAFPLVTGALVVAVDDQGATVAVPGTDAPRLAYAVSVGAVVLALTGT